PDSAVDADAPRAIAALRFLTVRSVLRSLPGQNQYSRGAAGAALASSQSGAPPHRPLLRSHVRGPEGRKSSVSKSVALPFGAAAWADRPPPVYKEGRMDSLSAEHRRQMDSDSRSPRSFQPDLPRMVGGARKGGQMSATVSAP